MNQYYTTNNYPYEAQQGNIGSNHKFFDSMSESSVNNSHLNASAHQQKIFTNPFQENYFNQSSPSKNLSERQLNGVSYEKNSSSNTSPQKTSPDRGYSRPVESHYNTPPKDIGLSPIPYASVPNSGYQQVDQFQNQLHTPNPNDQVRMTAGFGTGFGPFGPDPRTDANLVQSLNYSPYKNTGLTPYKSPGLDASNNGEFVELGQKERGREDNYFDIDPNNKFDNSQIHIRQHSNNMNRQHSLSHLTDDTKDLSQMSINNFKNALYKRDNSYNLNMSKIGDISTHIPRSSVDNKLVEVQENQGSSAQPSHRTQSSGQSLGGIKDPLAFNIDFHQNNIGNNSFSNKNASSIPPKQYSGPTDLLSRVNSNNDAQSPIAPYLLSRGNSTDPQSPNAPFSSSTYKYSAPAINVMKTAEEPKKSHKQPSNESSSANQKTTLANTYNKEIEELIDGLDGLELSKISSITENFLDDSVNRSQGTIHSIKHVDDKKDNFIKVEQKVVVPESEPKQQSSYQTQVQNIIQQARQSIQERGYNPDVRNPYNHPMDQQNYNQRPTIPMNNMFKYGTGSIKSSDSSVEATPVFRTLNPDLQSTNNPNSYNSSGFANSQREPRGVENKPRDSIQRVNNNSPFKRDRMADGDSMSDREQSRVAFNANSNIHNSFKQNSYSNDVMLEYSRDADLRANILNPGSKAPLHPTPSHTDLSARGQNQTFAGRPESVLDKPSPGNKEDVITKMQGLFHDWKQKNIELNQYINEVSQPISMRDVSLSRRDDSSGLESPLQGKFRNTTQGFYSANKVGTVVPPISQDYKWRLSERSAANYDDLPSEAGEVGSKQKLQDFMRDRLLSEVEQDDLDKLEEDQKKMRMFKNPLFQKKEEESVKKNLMIDPNFKKFDVSSNNRDYKQSSMAMINNIFRVEERSREATSGDKLKTEEFYVNEAPLTTDRSEKWNAREGMNMVENTNMREENGKKKAAFMTFNNDEINNNLPSFRAKNQNMELFAFEKRVAHIRAMSNSEIDDAELTIRDEGNRAISMPISKYKLPSEQFRRKIFGFPVKKSRFIEGIDDRRIKNSDMEIMCINCQEFINLNDVDKHSKTCLNYKNQRLYTFDGDTDHKLNSLNNRLKELIARIIEKSIKLDQGTLFCKKLRVILDAADKIMGERKDINKLNGWIQIIEQGIDEISRGRMMDIQVTILIYVNRLLFISSEKCTEVSELEKEEVSIKNLQDRLDSIETEMYSQSRNEIVKSPRTSQTPEKQLKSGFRTTPNLNKYLYKRDQEVLSQINSEIAQSDRASSHGGTSVTSGVSSVRLNFLQGIKSPSQTNRDESTKIKFYSQVVNVKLLLPPDHPGKDVLISDLYNDCLAEKIPQEGFDAFIKLRLGV